LNHPDSGAAVRGRLLLIPNTLDFGTWRDGEPAPDITEVLPLGVLREAARLTHWVAENAKSARALLKRVHAVVPLAQPLQALHIRELPRPPKGGGKPAAAGGGERTVAADLTALLAPALAGHDIGLVSEAGLPAVADPGAALVRAAHAAGLVVVPLSGPSSIVLAVAASGLNGQSFAFVGYLPTDAAARTQRLRELEQHSKRWQQTQLMIETPYRNAALLDALLASLQPQTWLSVSCGLTLASGWTRTETIAAWRAQRERTLPADVPAVFAFLA
jgi:16S rRNA (cytidine1402-2'-O)-methyltransferase